MISPNSSKFGYNSTHNKTANIDITIQYKNIIEGPVDPDNPTEGTENKTFLSSKILSITLILYKFHNRITTSKSVLHKELLVFTSSHFLVLFIETL